VQASFTVGKLLLDSPPSFLAKIFSLLMFAELEQNRLNIGIGNKICY
jgi:hypothetical protein